MIIRRRHTANYTTIGNALFDDERLAADEVGVLAYLRSRPHDWEVRRPALMRRWGIGRDALRRILHNLIRCGWIVARTTRLSNGTVHVIYEVQDEPGPQLSEDELRAAFSPAAAEPAEAADIAAEEPEETEGAPPDTGQPDTGQPDTGQPDTGQPDTAQPDTANPYPVIYKTLPSTDSTKEGFYQRRNPPKGARDFFDVREAWPPDHVLSYPVCEGLHASLTDRDREQAFRGIGPYLDDCRVKNRKVCDLSTYYRERRWERFAGKPSKPALFAVRRGTPQAARWREHLAVHEPARLKTFDLVMATSGAYTAPSEWPPGRASASPPAAPPAAAPDARASSSSRVSEQASPMTGSIRETTGPPRAA